MKAIALRIALLMMFTAGVAYAQPAEQPPHGGPTEPPTQSAAPGSHGMSGGEAGEGEGHPGGHEAGGHEAGGHHGDPTKHFNFTEWHWGKDVTGGAFGDGKNENPKTGAVVAGPEEKMSGPFVLMIVNFAIFLGLLAWKLRPAANTMAAERHDQIKNALEEAATLRQQAADKLSEYELKLRDADAEIARMVEGMRKDAEADKARILDNAEKQAAQMKRDAEQRIAAEIELARAVLTREVTSAATTATEKLLKDNLQPMDQAKLVASFINDVNVDRQAKERV
ncbi:MAG: hypothetical protein AB7P03_18475 [Kofleriaceae bacterium]